MKPIEIVAKSFGIAPIRVHQLIRNKQIAFRADHNGVYVNQDELQRWFDDHIWTLMEWQEAFKKTQKNLIANGYVKTFRNH